MNKSLILNKLFAKQRFGIVPGLDRTLALSEALGNPHKIKAVHVAGTNGKGSVCSFIASLFMEAGYKTGLYTSPHIFDFNERIRINGVKINDEEMAETALKVLEVADKINATFFEITTVMAFDYFRRNNVDIAVIETGMGGRFDSTNIIVPELSVITKIDIDHKEYLGNTLEEIAFEKAGIIKPDVPVLALAQQENVMNILKSSASSANAPFFDTSAMIVNNDKITPELRLKLDVSTALDYYAGIVSPLPGLPQKSNLSLAIRAFELLKDKFNLSKNNLYSAILNVKQNTGISFRFDKINDNPLIIADAAHNPAAVIQLRETLERFIPGQKWNFVFGGMKDKDLELMIKELSPLINSLIAVKADIERSASADFIATAAKKFTANVFIAKNVREGLELAKELGSPAVVCGSFYILAEIDELPLNKE